MICYPKVEKICNFTEACEWIAFGWKPTELIYKFTDASLLDENDNPIIEEAKQKKIGYNSLYMKIMDKVIDDLSITEKNQPSKKSIYYHVLAKYAKQYNLSNNTIQMIASLILNPESRLGKAKK